MMSYFYDISNFFIISSNLSAQAFLLSSKACVYISIVIDVSEWPNLLLTVLGSTPELIKRLAHVCLNSWKHIGSRLYFFTIFLNIWSSEEIDFKDVFDKEQVLEILTTNPIKGQNNITFSKLNLLSYGKNIPFLFLPISNIAKKKALNQTIFIIFNYNSAIDIINKMLNESKDGNGNRHIFMNMKYIEKRDKN